MEKPFLLHVTEKRQMCYTTDSGKLLTLAQICSSAEVEFLGWVKKRTI